MSEITKDFIKFVAEVLVLLVIFSVVFSPEGIASGTFNYFVFAEPILLQNYIASALTVGSQTKGEFFSDIKLTSGLPHTIKIFFKDGIPYVSVIPAQEAFLKTEFSTIEPTPIITNCNILEQEIKLPQKTAQTVVIEKTFVDDKCKLILTLGAGVKPAAGNLFCSDGTAYGQCSSLKPSYCDNGSLIAKCSVCGCNAGYECRPEDCYLPSYKEYQLKANTLVDIIGKSLSNVQVSVDTFNNLTDSNGIATFTPINPGIHKISVPSLVDSRPFSHFWDHDCDRIDIGYYLDTGNNPFTFNTYNRNKEITAIYKVFTKITNLNYDNTAISGKLLDEINNPLIQQGNYHPNCENSSKTNPVPINKNVTLEYYKNGTWYYIGNAISSAIDGSFSYDWECCSINATKIRANYTPFWQIDWYYMPNTTEADIPCLCKLTVIAQIDVFSSLSVPSPLSPVKVNVNGNITHTDSSGITIYYLPPSSNNNISVDNPFVDILGLRPFSHFWDNECNLLIKGYWLDNESNPYTFSINRTKNITAQYKAFTNITNPLGVSNTFDFNGTVISGKLLDEKGGTLIPQGSKHPVCENLSTPSTNVSVNRNVTLEYSTDNGVTWNPIGVVDSLSNGNWSINWIWVSGANRLRATYTPVPQNWFYNGTSVEISLYKLIVFTVLDIEGPNNPPVPSVNVTVDSFSKATDASGIAEFFIKPSDHKIRVEDPAKYSKPTSSSTFSQFGASVLNPENAFDDNYNDTSTHARLEAAAILTSLALLNLNFSGVKLNSRIFYTWEGAGSAARGIQLWDYSTGNWDPTSIGTAPLSLTTESYQITNSKYIQNGNLRARFFVVGLGSVATSMNLYDVHLYTLRPFSHFWDHDCDSLDHYLDTNVNPYTFTTWEKDRNITAFYKTFTKITNTLGAPNTFEYDDTNIKGKLLDEHNNPIGQTAHKTLVCGVAGTTNPMYRNITLDYYKNGNWYYLGTVETSTSDGSWSYDWKCICNTTKLRATYNHTDWYYNSTSAEINIDTSLCPCKLTVNTFLDIPGSPPLPSVNVNVNGNISTTNASGITEFLVKPGYHNILVENPKDSRPFSHFWDHDCDSSYLGYYLDNESNPFGFSMFSRDKEITAWYKTFTNITNSSGNQGFDFDGSTISGKLLDEKSNVLRQVNGNYHPKCEDPKTINDKSVNRNVTLEYSTDNGITWNPIKTVDSLANGSWSYLWSCAAGANMLRASYTPIPSNWYYNGTSVEKSISCKGTLDVYAFASGTPVNAKVAIGLGDVNWDGVVNDADLWYYNSSNPNNCYNTKPGDPKWNIDCDMNLDNVINIFDVVAVAGQYGKSISINTTHFTVNLLPGTYQLRSKYNNQIKNNLSVVINAGQTTRVDFNFLSCDGFTALNCSVPPLAHATDVRVWGDPNCGRTDAKIDCDGVYNSHHVCNPSTCSLVEPSITSYSVSKTSMVVGESFSISVNGNCPADLPGKCGIECRVIHPDGHYIEIDSWNYGSATLPSVTCDQIGNYTVDYCVVATDFYANRGWGGVNGTKTTITCTNKGTLDVYAFASGNPVNAKVALGLGDINWDGVVNDADLWFFNSTNPNNCYNTKPGDPKWNIDCDMNLDNVIDIRDLATVAKQYGKTIPINTTYFTTTLNAGTYDLRAKYNNQIKNNLSVVINAGQTTRVDFNFLSCDGFVALNRIVPPTVHPEDERIWGDLICGRVNAKIDCDGVYNSHHVCNNNVPSSCTLIEPTINSYSVSTTSINVGDSFTVSVNGFCPADLPGKCLIECRVIHPDGHYIELDSWDEDGSTTLPSATCDQIGNYTVDYCVVYTDFVINRGWGGWDGIKTNVSCVPTPLYELTFKAQVDVTEYALQGVQVNVDGVINNTQADGTVTYQLPTGPHTMSVQSQSDSRQFSHFWDHDCDNFGNYYDTSGSPFGTYTFKMFNKDKNITAQYKTFTNITDSAGNPGFEYDGTKISGKLLDEYGNPIGQTGGKAPTCGGLGIRIPIDANIALGYYDGSWHPISTTKFFDDFNDGDYNGWTVGSGTWSVTNGELSDSGSGGAEYINTNWNGWNSNDYVSANIKLSGVDVWVKIFDGSKEYYFQTWDGYNTLHLYVNGVHTKSVALAGISPSNWNMWKINQTGTTIEIYINDQKWMDYSSAPIINNGKIQLRTSNPTIAFFDNVNVDGVIYYKDGKWSYPWAFVSAATKLRATYNPSNWYYNYTSSEIVISCAAAGGFCTIPLMCGISCFPKSGNCIGDYGCDFFGILCCCVCS